MNNITLFLSALPAMKQKILSIFIQLLGFENSLTKLVSKATLTSLKAGWGGCLVAWYESNMGLTKAGRNRPEGDNAAW